VLPDKKCNSLFVVSCFFPGYSHIVTTKKNFVAFRIPPELKKQIQEIADREARSVSQICGLLLIDGVEAYKRDGAKFMRRLVSRQRQRAI
jgi:hypothetical protein